jgi:hypothetical protein
MKSIFVEMSVTLALVVINTGVRGLVSGLSIISFPGGETP